MTTYLTISVGITSLVSLLFYRAEYNKLSLLFLVIAIVLSICALVTHRKELKAKKKTRSLPGSHSTEQKLNTSSEQVLLTFFDETTELSVLHFERLCIFQGINGAQYYLDELLKHEYIAITGGTKNHPNYSITAKGRKYIKEKHITRVSS